MFKYYEVHFKFTPATPQLHYGRYVIQHCRPVPGNLRPAGVIFFPINAPGMGCFKLFDFVGYS